MSQCAVVDYNSNKCDFSLRLNCPKLMSCRSSGGRSFQTLGPAAAKLLSPKLVFVRGTTHVLSLADRSSHLPLSATSCTSSAMCRRCGVGDYKQKTYLSRVEDVRNEHFVVSSIKDLFDSIEAHKIIDFIKETRFYKQL